VSALASAWGHRLKGLTLDGAEVSGTFFPAVAMHLPGLQSLTILSDPNCMAYTAACIMGFCSRLTRPLKLALPPDLLE
jgi:hypothetical protein